MYLLELKIQQKQSYLTLILLTVCHLFMKYINYHLMIFDMLQLLLINFKQNEDSSHLHRNLHYKIYN